MRFFILSLRPIYQLIFIIGLTLLLAFLAAMVCGMFFDVHQLRANTDLISSVYQVLGTVYAILLTFTLWGVWQRFNEATTSVQKEAYALLDLVSIIETSPHWQSANIRNASLDYFNVVIKNEWFEIKNITGEFDNKREPSHPACMRILQEVHGITPQDERETTIFNQTLVLVTQWLDARRTRMLIARGDSAKSLWPLLITGALVLFAFHGLFVARTVGIWGILLFGFSLVIGLTFYLIFTLDCPFIGSLSIDSAPYRMAVNILELGEKK